ncbi:MAG: flagellar type III secretion system pore protein FliP, partial [Pyrinomonadaceae bacterium]
MKRLRQLIPALTVLLFIASAPLCAFAAGEPAGAAATTGPNVTLDLSKGSEGGSLPVQILVLLTLLSFIPAILVSMTCFTRLIVVFHFLRQALGTQETPNNQVLIGLSLFLTMFVMAPVVSRVNSEALQPMLAGQISQTEALDKALVPLRGYMLKHTRERDLALFIRLTNGPRPRTADEVATSALIPAYMISELKTAFQIGFVLFIPFLIIDMAVASV